MWLKYMTWALTALLPLSETFFHNWTREVPGDRKRLTPYGRVALALTLVALSLSLFLTVRDDRAQALDREAAERNAILLDETKQDLQKISDELVTSKTAEVTALAELTAKLDALAKLPAAEAHKTLQATTQQAAQTLASAKLQVNTLRTQTNNILRASAARTPVRVAAIKQQGP